MPLVSKMDREHKLDEGLVKTLFENGLMGVEAAAEYGGSECNFLTMMLVVEELSKGSYCINHLKNKIIDEFFYS